MMRRIAVPMNPAVRARSFFYAEAGCEGIMGASLHFMVRVVAAGFPIGAFMIARTVERYDTGSQWVGDCTDLFESDGTPLEGEEANAQMRMHYERIQPYMDKIKEKLDAE